MKLSYQSLGVDPDGAARFLVRVAFVNAKGQNTALVAGGDVEFFTTSSSTQWQTRARFNGPAAIVRTKSLGNFSVRAEVERPMGIEPETIRIANVEPRVVAKPLGPYAVQVGWFPQATGTTKVERTGPNGTRTVCARIAQSSSCLDVDVQPGATYKYAIERPGAPPAFIAATLPPKPADDAIDTFRGKGMWLRFSPDNSDSDAYSTFDPASVVRTAQRAGLRYVELRLSYGEFWEVTPNAKPTIDALIDALTRARIAVIGWSVPRSTSFEDIATTVAAANYRTPSGSAMAGIAVDLERGSDYLGDGLDARASIATYVKTLREALGPKRLIIATVEDPYSGNLTDRDIPYADVAATASVLQPMAYWRMYETAVGASQTASLVENSIRQLRKNARRNININFGGQTLGLGECGAPPPDEIQESLKESKAIGAMGETFFDWNGTYDKQWAAIGLFHW
jgi:hypothetical protein